MTYTVTKHTGSHYLLSALPEWKQFPAVLKGNLRIKGSSTTNPVAVGDIVEASVPENCNEQNPATITAIKERRNYVIRRSANLSRQEHIIAANVDRAFIVATLDFPEVKLPFLDRILLTCEVYGIKATIILNKCDLYSDEYYAERIADFKDIYETGAGYPVLLTSAKKGIGIDELRELCKDSVSLFSGVSGTGKSSLIKALDPSLNPRTGEISLSHLQGKHTTTFYEMYPLSSGGFIIDTPGIRGFGIVDVAPEELPLYFPEMLELSRSCRFTPCTHTHEPGCAVKAALDEGSLRPERYNSYIGMLNENESKYR